MSLKGFAPGKRIESPRGMWQSVANRRANTPSRGSFAQNVRFRFGTARTRPGTSAVFASAGAVTGMFNWITPGGTNLVLYQDGSSIKSYTQALATSATLVSGLNTATVAFAVSATTNASPDVLTVPGHTFSNGDFVVGSGALGDTAINGIFAVSNVSGSTLELLNFSATLVAGNGAYTGGGILTRYGAGTPNFAPLDVWAYFCDYSTAGPGAYQARIFDGVNVDKAFRPPPTITGWTACDAGAGQCTQGQHFIGFCYQNRTGYTGIPVTAVLYAITATTSVSFSVTATTNASPDVLTVPGHTFSNGDTVTGSGATGDAAINGVFLVTGVSGSNLELTDLQGNPVAGNGAYTGSGVLTAPLLITAPGNNLLVGERINISPTGNAAAYVNTTPTPGSTFTLTDLDGNLINSSAAYVVGAYITNPIQFTTAAGLRQINITVSLPAMPDGGTDATGGVQATLFMIATATNNPNLWYFIPSNTQTGQIGEQPVPLNTPTTYNFVLSMSDFDMNDSLSGDTAQANFLLLAQDSNGNGPFNPNFVVAYGQRMCYGTGTVLYASDINNPQQISADTNQIIMQNQRTIGFAFPLPGNQNLYLTGDKWCGYVTDNSDSPSTWGEPIPVSDQLGAPFPNCVCSSTGGPWVWIVTEGGPYLFDGAFESQPLTYLCSGLNEQQQLIGWSRINWSAASVIKIIDNVQEFKLYIAVPLDGATQCNYMFCIDYRLGKTFDTVDISLDIFNPALFGSIAVIKEYASNLSNVWIGPAAAGNVARFDITTHNDQGAAINGIWKSGLAKGNQIVAPMVRVGNIEVWARGNAPLDVNGLPTLLVTILGLDGTQTFPITVCTTQGVPAALTETPGLTLTGKVDASKLSDYSVQFQVNEVDGWFELSGFTSWQKSDLFGR